MDQTQIIQEIFQLAAARAEEGWTEMIIDCHIDDSQSDFGNSYLLQHDGALVEKSLPLANGLDRCVRQLRLHLAQASRPPFTHFKLHAHATGKYEASYGYETVDWEGLVLRDWNFFPKNTHPFNA